MTLLKIVDRSGAETGVDGSPELTVMEIVRDHGLDELQALCGGCCSCATCHVFVDPDYVDRLQQMSEDENDLLDSSSHRRANSRLSCQIRFTEALDGLTVQIAPED